MGVELIIGFILLGMFVGVMAGLLGIGGGGILVPVLTSIFIYQGFPKDSIMHIALGTSMACIAFTSFSSMWSHHQNDAVIWPLAKTMSIGMVIGTFSATFLVAYLSSKVLAIFFAVFMAYVSIQMFNSKQTTFNKQSIHQTELRFVTLGIGGISALVSIAGGSLTVPYLAWRGIDIRKAIGTSAALGFAISIAGTLGYLINGTLNSNTANTIATNASTTQYTLGYIYFPAVLLVAIPSFFTAPLGAKLTQRLPVQILKKIFGVLLMILSLKMAISFI
ncbi:MAG: sulfite exporter TauE/SafE family protein [Pseudomonadota bacterium]